MKNQTEKVNDDENDNNDDDGKETVWVKQNNRESHTDGARLHNDGARMHTDGTRIHIDGANEKLPIVYSKNYSVCFCGLEKLHPFDAAKGRHIQKFLCQHLNLEPGQFYAPKKEISKAQLLQVHTREYLQSLKWSVNAARISEIPLLIFVPNRCVQRGYLRPMRFQTAGSIMAGKLALEHGWAINLGGGFHHCYSSAGGGFCPYADITLLISRLFEEEPQQVRKAMIVDLDAHQGNGHERDFKDNANVYILDMYNASIYPKDHPAKLSIRCAIELKPRTADELYLKKLKRSLKFALDEFQPDIVIYNAGTDILEGDPIGLLDITAEGVIARDQFVFSTFRKRNIPIVMLLSGGYLKASAKVIADSVVNLKHQSLLT